MIGKRIYNLDQGVHEGDYGRMQDLVVAAEPGKWMVCTPTGLKGTINDKTWTIIEHADRTITVSPSILVRDYQGNEWHGYLEKGVWREC